MRIVSSDDDNHHGEDDKTQHTAIDAKQASTLHISRISTVVHVYCRSSRALYHRTQVTVHNIYTIPCTRYYV